MQWSIKRTLQVESEPVTLTEARTYMRINSDDTSQDTHIEQVLIPAARQYVEEFTGRQLLTATWRLRLQCFPKVILLPYPPLLAVSSITYLDTAGTSQTLSSSNYTVWTDLEPGQIQEAYGYYWPAVRDGEPTSITIVYTSGYGTTATDVPKDFKRAILCVVADMYEFRESTVTGTIKVNLDVALDRILARYMSPFDKPWLV